MLTATACVTEYGFLIHVFRIWLTCVIAAIEQERTNALNDILHMLNDFRKAFLKGSKGCGHLCSSMLLGLLIKMLDKYKIRLDQPSEVLSNKSIMELKSMVQEPPASGGCYQAYFYNTYEHQPCNLKQMLATRMDQIWGKLNGLRLADYQA